MIAGIIFLIISVIVCIGISQVIKTHGFNIKEIQLTNGIVAMVDYETGEIINSTDKPEVNHWTNCSRLNPEICDSCPEFQQYDLSDILIYRFQNDTKKCQYVGEAPISK